MYSEIVQRTPSIYFKFDDENHKNNFSKSSYALDYSISNQKHVLSQRFNKLRTNGNTSNRHEMTSKQQTYSPVRHGCSPLRGQYTLTIEKSSQNQKMQEEQDEFMKLHRCRNDDSKSSNPSNNLKKIVEMQDQKSTNNINEPTSKNSTKLKTEDFFEEFDQKYSFTFEEDIRTHEFIPEADYEGSSKISRGFLDFEEFPVEETMKLIQIDSKKDLIKIDTVHSNFDLQPESNEINNSCQINSSNSSHLVSFIKTNENIFSSHVTISDEDHQKTTNKQNNPELSNQRSLHFSTDQQNHNKNSETEFQEVISFGPDNPKPKKYVAINCRHFITKDFNNNSSIFEKSKPIIEPKRRVPLKSIENLIQKSVKDQTRSQTRKKPIINTDLLISTINKTEKHQVKQTHGVWSNPINNRKSQSLESTFTYNNMFKTNAFRETLKSTTLENWRKKYHKKIENMGEKKTVSKRHRDSNIFENLFIRA